MQKLCSSHHESDAETYSLTKAAAIGRIEGGCYKEDDIARFPPISKNED